MQTEYSYISVFREASGTRLRRVDCKSALTPPLGILSTNRSKAVVRVLLFLYSFVVNSTRRFIFTLALRSVFVFFNPYLHCYHLAWERTS